MQEYVRYRPSYPIEVVRTLEHEAGVAPNRTRIADIGCGTGISAALFLREGYSVTGVEPNAHMRHAAEAQLGASPRFRLVAGTAEHIPLPDSCCELIVAAQAFHWFELETARSEMRRILAADGLAALIWNDRRTDSSAFLRDYESILLRYGTDYAKVVHRNLTESGISAFFGPDGCDSRVFYSHQDFDLAGLKGRAISSSYVPRPGQPGHDELMRALTEAFHRHARSGSVRFEYDTRLYFGRLSR